MKNYFIIYKILFCMIFCDRIYKDMLLTLMFQAITNQEKFSNIYSKTYFILF